MKRTLHILLFLSPLLLLRAQEYAFRSFTVHDGLASNYITTITQDSKGYLWIGTDEGFSIFDGRTFQNIRSPKVPIWGQINSFCESRKDPEVMLVATNGAGFLRYSKGEYTTILVDTLPGANNVNDLCEDDSGTLWCSTDNGVYRVSSGTVQRCTLPGQDQAYSQIMVHDPGHLWITSTAGVTEYDIATGTAAVILRTHIEGTNGQIIPLRTPGEELVIGAGAVYRHRNGRFHRELTLNERTTGNGAIDLAGDVWIGGMRHVLQLKDSKEGFRVHTTFDRSNGMPVNDVTMLLCDREGNIWFGTAGKGIVRLQGPENMRFRFENLSSRGTADPRGRIWMPAVGMISVVWNDGRSGWQTQEIPFGSRPYPIAVQSDGKDTLWCTLSDNTITGYRVIQGGASRRFHLEPFVHLGPAQGLPSVFGLVFYRDSIGWLWCAQNHGGVVVLETRPRLRVLRVISPTDPTEGPIGVSSFCESANGHVFTGGKGSDALYEYERHRNGPRLLRVYRYREAISPNGIRSMTTSEDGSVWIGTRYDGIVRMFPDGQWRRYTYDDGLHSMQVLSLFADRRALWIGTQSGMEYVANIDTPRFTLSTELTRSPIYTIGRYNDSTFWAMSRYEMTLNQPVSAEASTFAPPLYLTRFEANGIAQQFGGSPEYSKGDLGSCSFSYACVTMRGSTDVKYQYRMEGLHRDWQPLTQERSVTFANLGAGNYTFTVRAVINGGERITPVVTQSFIVVPPLYDRWWFGPLLVALLFTAVAGIYSFRIRQRFALEKIRVSIAADLHDDIGSVLARIANLADILVMSGGLRRSTAKPKTVRTPRTPAKGGMVSAQTIADLSRNLMEKMSDVVWSVDPQNDDPKKLTERIQTYCTEMAELHHLMVEFTADGVFERQSIDPQRSRAALLIVKESLANILKHAKATRVSLNVQILPKQWSITIADDGAGFQEADLPRINGIYNMRARAEACGGTVSVTSRPGEGTTVRLDIPL